MLVRLEAVAPRSRVKHSNIEPLRSLILNVENNKKKYAPLLCLT